jgi:hypothetical protein
MRLAMKRLTGRCGFGAVCCCLAFAAAQTPANPVTNATLQFAAASSPAEDSARTAGAGAMSFGAGEGADALLAGSGHSESLGDSSPIATLPEPSALALGASGLLLLGLITRRRARR